MASPPLLSSSVQAHALGGATSSERAFGEAIAAGWAPPTVFFLGAPAPNPRHLTHYANDMVEETPGVAHRGDSHLVHPLCEGRFDA